MFGLLILIFSIYYYDGHLNSFDKKQALSSLDSIHRVRETNLILAQINKARTPPFPTYLAHIIILNAVFSWLNPFFKMPPSSYRL